MSGTLSIWFRPNVEGSVGYPCGRGRGPHARSGRGRVTFDLGVVAEADEAFGNGNGGGAAEADSVVVWRSVRDVAWRPRATRRGPVAPRLRRAGAPNIIAKRVAISDWAAGSVSIERRALGRVRDARCLCAREKLVEWKSESCERHAAEPDRVLDLRPNPQSTRSWHLRARPHRLRHLQIGFHFVRRSHPLRARPSTKNITRKSSASPARPHPHPPLHLSPLHVAHAHDQPHQQRQKMTR